jgi:hypothetical protein
MRRAFRSAFALTIALALVASTAAWRQCTALRLAATAIANIEAGSIASNHHHAASDHVAHDHHATHQHDVADDPATPPADDHGCMKCCTMCSVANATLPAAHASVTFNVSTHMFSQRHETWSGSTITVDPGIPKRIV